MAGPKRIAEDIDAAIERERTFKQQKTGLPTQADPEGDWLTSTKTQGVEEDQRETIHTTTGMWQYTSGDKPTRTWVDRRSQSTLEEGTGALNLDAHTFEAESCDGEISHAYHELWVGGRQEEFVEAIIK